ncbi:MAG TPA: AsmA family protein, partial [Edaphobacter sp.]|nr:AsmA family protein [Edaphobacter sp.]
MASRHRTLLIVLGSLLVLILVAVLAVPLFLNADSFRTRIETELSASMGRKVTLGKLDLSVWSGSLVAQNATVSDDPSFSSQPFLTAQTAKINIQMIPLILSKQVHITGFSIEAPKVNLIRHANGTWNYSSIGASSSSKGAAPAAKPSSMTGVTVSHVDISDGQVTVSTENATGLGAGVKRTYDQVSLTAKDFAFDRSFPFTLSADLPGDGKVTLNGNAGPVNTADASLTPFGAKLSIQHLDPVAAGFLDKSAGITGTIGSINLVATWNGQQLHVNNLSVDTPNLNVVRKAVPTNTVAAPTKPDSNDMLSTMVADHLQVKNGTISLHTAGQSKPAVYQQLNAEVTNLSPTGSSPFKINALVPGGGSLNADGTAGPVNYNDAGSTPFNAHAVLHHIDLASSGLVAPETGISGLSDIDARAVSDGRTLNANISANAQNLQLARNGSPSQKPVNLRATLSQNMQALTGQIQSAALTVGNAVINMQGTYQTSGPTTAINLKVSGQSLSIDELQAFLPSVGVHLPTGSRLQGGTLTANLDVTGSTANPIISGPIRLQNTNLAGFDLGSKLSAVTALTGAKTGSMTAIRSLSANIRVADGNVRTDNVALDIPSLGTATGAGTVASSGALNYNLILKLTGLLGTGKPDSAPGIGGIAGQLMGLIPNGGAAGGAGGFALSALRNGIPVAITGTTANPTFTPNLSGAVKSGATSFTA